MTPPQFITPPEVTITCHARDKGRLLQKPITEDASTENVAAGAPRYPQAGVAMTLSASS